MAFITKTDILRHIPAEELAEITRSDDTIINIAIDKAVAEMKAYLAGRYDTVNIFNKTGTGRNSLIVVYGCDISIYEIIKIVRPGIDLEDRRARYDRAIEWFQMVLDEKINPDLPILVDADGDSTKSRVLVRCNKRRNQHYEENRTYNQELDGD